MENVFDTTTKTGTAAGTLLTIFANISSEDLLKTVILAAVGAAVSFVVTILLKAVVHYFYK
jgi:mannitol-specific phosphotransferase system IIBC component